MEEVMEDLLQIEMDAQALEIFGQNYHELCPEQRLRIRMLTIDYLRSGAA